MSNSLKLSTALPGEDEVNGLDALADDLVSDPSKMVCAVLLHGRPHKPDWTADGTCRRCTPTVARKRADFLAEVERLLDAGVPSDQLASRVGYGSAVSLRRRLDTLDRHDLARRIKPYTRERKAS